MKIGIDCHIHIYPYYSLPLLFNSAFDNLSKSFPEAELQALILTERSDCHYFRSLKFKKISIPGFRVEDTLDPNSLKITRESCGSVIYLIAGRQINSSERLEFLALTKDVEIKDGLSAEETIKAINTAGAVAILNWAPGKWSFNRKNLAAELLRTSPPPDLLLGDTSLRSRLFPPHTFFSSGRKITQGSDPLPFKGQETLVGTLGIFFEDPTFNPSTPGQSINTFLKNPSSHWTSLGNPSNLFSIFVRLLRNEIQRQALKFGE